MPQNIRSFRKYLEELSGNNYLRKKVASLERADKRLVSRLDELKDEIKLLKKYKAVAIPKKRGKKPKPMIRIIEEEMGKKKDKTMKVTEIVKVLKKKRGKTRGKNLYSSVAASLSNNPGFVKSGVGEFKLVGKKKADKKTSKGKK